MGFRLVKHQTLQVTSALAKRVAAMPRAQGERPLKEFRLQVYEKIARKGEFRPVNWAIAHCLETNDETRVNGQHTSNLFASLPLKDLPPIYVYLERYDCDTTQDVARLYGSFDSKISSRTQNEINNQFASQVESLREIGSKVISVCVGGIWYAKLQDQYAKVQPVERAESILEHEEFVVWVQEMLGSLVSLGHIRRLPVVGAMLLTWQRHPKQATEFWTLVRDESAEKPADASRKLAKFLLTHGAHGRAGAPARYRVQDREFFVKSLHAWNAWRSGSQTDLKYFPESEIPTVR